MNPGRAQRLGNQHEAKSIMVGGLRQADQVGSAPWCREVSPSIANSSQAECWALISGIKMKSGSHWSGGHLSPEAWGETSGQSRKGEEELICNGGLEVTIEKPIW